jgi:hypothetical protein
MQELWQFCILLLRTQRKRGILVIEAVLYVCWLERNRITFHPDWGPTKIQSITLCNLHFSSIYILSICPLDPNSVIQSIPFACLPSFSSASERYKELVPGRLNLEAPSSASNHD